MNDNLHYTTEITTYSSSSPYSKGCISPVRFILSFILLVLIVFMLYNTASGNGINLTFSNFLSYIQNVPDLKIPVGASIFEDMLIRDGWGFFDFLRLAINTFTTILGFVIYLGSGFLQLVMFVVYTLGFFVGL